MSDIKKPRCGAKLQIREGYCKRYPEKGKTRCKYHGGASTNQIKHGQTRALKHGQRSIFARESIKSATSWLDDMRKIINNIQHD